MKRLLFYTLFVLFQQAFSPVAVGQAKEEFDNMIFNVPPGFTTNKTAASMALADGDGSSSQYFNITIHKSVFSLKRIEKSYPEAWRESLLSDGVDNPAPEPSFIKASTPSGWNYFRGG